MHVQGRKAAQTGKELIEKVLTHQRVNQKQGKKNGEALKPWIEMPKSRLECCLALKKFLEYAVAEHRQPQAFLISEKDYLEVRGADSKRRKKAVLTDAEVLGLIRVLPETWGNVIRICRVFGVRSWEVSFITRATNDDGEPQLRVTKGKTYNTRGGIKEETSHAGLRLSPSTAAPSIWWRTGTSSSSRPLCLGRPSGPSCAVSPTGSS